MKALTHIQIWVAFGAVLLSVGVYIYGINILLLEADRIHGIRGNIAYVTHKEEDARMLVTNARESKIIREKLDARFLTTDTFIELFSLFERIGDVTDVDVVVVSADEVENSGTTQGGGQQTTIGSVRIVASLTGSFASVLDAIHALEFLPYAITLTSVDMSRSEKQWSARVILEAYTL
jgi:hypothetical protein